MSPKQSSYFTVCQSWWGPLRASRISYFPARCLNPYPACFKYPPKTYSRIKAASCCPGRWHFQPPHSASLCTSPFSIPVSFLSGKRKELLFSLHQNLYLGTIIYKIAIKTFSQLQPNRYCLQTGDDTPINRHQIQTTSKSRSLCVSFSACTSDLNLKVYLSDGGVTQQDPAETHC